MACMEVLLSGKGRRKLAITLAVFQSFFVLCALAVTLIGFYIYMTLEGFARNLDAKQNIYLSKLMMIGGLVVAIFHLYCAKLCLAVTDQETRQKFFGALAPTAIVYFAAICAIFSIGISCFVEKTQIQETMGKSFKLAMYRYRADSTVKVTLDKLQMSYGCCGSDDYKNWFHINWMNPQIANYEKIGKNSVPFSCCDPHSSRPCVHIDVTEHSQMYKYNPKKDNTLYKNGCKKAIVRHTLQNVLIPTGIGVFIWFLLELLVWLAFRILQTSLYTAMTWGDPDGPAPGWVSTLGGAMPLTRQKDAQDVESQLQVDDQDMPPTVTEVTHLSPSGHEIEPGAESLHDRELHPHGDVERDWEQECEPEPEPEHQSQSHQGRDRTLPLEPALDTTIEPAQQPIQQPAQSLAQDATPFHTPGPNYARQPVQNLTSEPVQDDSIPLKQMTTLESTWETDQKTNQHPAQSLAFRSTQQTTQVLVEKPGPDYAQQPVQDLTLKSVQHSTPVKRITPVEPTRELDQKTNQHPAQRLPFGSAQQATPAPVQAHAPIYDQDLTFKPVQQNTPLEQIHGQKYVQQPTTPVYKPAPVYAQKVAQDNSRETTGVTAYGYGPEPEQNLPLRQIQQPALDSTQTPVQESLRQSAQDHAQHREQKQIQKHQTPRQRPLKGTIFRTSSIRLIHAKMETSNRQKGGASTPAYQAPATTGFSVSGRYPAPPIFAASDKKKENLVYKPKKWVNNVRDNEATMLFGYDESQDEDDDDSQLQNRKKRQYQKNKALTKIDKKDKKEKYQKRTKVEKAKKEDKQMAKTKVKEGKKETYKKKEQEKKKDYTQTTKAKNTDKKERGRSKDKQTVGKQPESRSKSKTPGKSTEKKGGMDKTKSKSGRSSTKSSRGRSVSSTKGKSKTTSKSKSPSKSRSPHGKSGKKIKKK